MAIIKCKMCGGDLDISEGLSVCECEYCGTKQTVPTADNEKKLTLFGRANRLRLANEFDKAAGVYESIVADFPEEAEAYWGLALCRYGIEYVDDPATGKKVPTCHRVSFDSVLEDPDFDQACENADAIARRQYREEAKQIEDIRRGIIEVSGKEAPYDIFICYKETAENGDRTIDSVIAQDVYDALTEKGYRVFFSRISLEDKLGTEYEPYIFAALNSAKIMLAFGTDFEYYNAVWVKNEWSRFLKLMEKDKSKHLIPCYKNLDPYDMPKEFQRLQGQDMGKVGAVQDLLRGIDKLMGKDVSVPKAQQQTIIQQVSSGEPNVMPLLQRGKMALEDCDWEKADDFFEQVLNMDAKNSDAYLGKLLCSVKKTSLSELDRLSKESIAEVEGNRLYQRALQFATKEKVQELEGLLSTAKERIHTAETRLSPIRDRFRPTNGLIAAGELHTVGLRLDGTVLAVGCNNNGQCDVSSWRDVVALAVGIRHTVGLRADGTVVATRFIKPEKDWFEYSGQCDVSSWRDVVAIAAGTSHTVGLRSDGTVLAVGNNEFGQCNVSAWRNVVAVSASYSHTVGLRADGTVVATRFIEKTVVKYSGQCDVSTWRDVVAIAAGAQHTAGLRSDGTVLAVGKNEFGQCDVSTWRDVVAVYAGEHHTVGLRADGTVVATRFIENEKSWLKYSGQCDVSAWSDVVAITAGVSHTVGLRADGKVLAVGSNKYGQCDVDGWKLFASFETLDQEREEVAERAKRERKEAAERAEAERKAAAKRAEAERQRKIATLNDEKAKLNTELANLKGLFTGKRRKEIETRLAEINAELKKLQ